MRSGGPPIPSESSFDGLYETHHPDPDKVGKGVFAANIPFEPVPEAVADLQTAVRGRAVLMGTGPHQFVRLVLLQVGKQVPFFCAGDLLLADTGHDGSLPSADTGHMVVDDLVEVPEEAVQKTREGGGIVLQG